MTIIGFSKTEFKGSVTQIPSFFGTCDTVKAKPVISFEFFGWSRSANMRVNERSLYLHIPKDLFSSCTGLLKEWVLPWLWQTVYLDQGDKIAPRKILAYTRLSAPVNTDIALVFGKSFPVAILIDHEAYASGIGMEFFRFPEKNLQQQTFKNIWGSFSVSSDKKYCHIYRSRSLFSRIKYLFLKCLSSAWKEVTIKAGAVSEKILIQKEDKDFIKREARKLKDRAVELSDD